jgi:hypothetical protein
VAHIALGHRLTGLCPTFSRPTLQRDGYLLRVPLVGGLLDLSQVECLTEVARGSSNGIVELTNRGNLQLRGLARDALRSALEACRAVGLGDAAASLVTISPFAGPAEHRLRVTLVCGLADLDLDRLSSKFVVHIDDAEGTTADRSRRPWPATGRGALRGRCPGPGQHYLSNFSRSCCVGARRRRAVHPARATLTRRRPRRR